MMANPKRIRTVWVSILNWIQATQMIKYNILFYQLIHHQYNLTQQYAFINIIDLPIIKFDVLNIKFQNFIKLVNDKIFHMGASESDPFKKQLTDYRVINKIPQKNITHLAHIETDKQYLLHQLTFNDQNQYAKCYDEHKKRLNLSAEHLTHLGRVQGKQIDHLCSNIYKLYAIWDYPYRFLSQQLEERALQKRKFQQKQIWSILASCIFGMSTLQENKIKHQCLSTNTILLDNEGIVKVADPLAAATTKNFDAVYNNRSIENIYLSPQQCQNLQTRSGYSNSYKNDIWSMGMIILECGLLQNQSKCYRNNYQKVDYNRINENLNRFVAEYGQQFKDVLQSMLKRDEKDRPDWIALKQFANKSTIKTQNSHNNSYGNAYNSGNQSQRLRQRMSYSPISKDQKSSSFNQPSHIYNKSPINDKQVYPGNQPQSQVRFNNNYSQSQTNAQPISSFNYPPPLPHNQPNHYHHSSNSNTNYNTPMYNQQGTSINSNFSPNSQYTPFTTLKQPQPYKPQYRPNSIQKAQIYENKPKAYSQYRPNNFNVSPSNNYTSSYSPINSNLPPLSSRNQDNIFTDPNLLKMTRLDQPSTYQNNTNFGSSSSYTQPGHAGLLLNNNQTYVSNYSSNTHQVYTSPNSRPYTAYNPISSLPQQNSSYQDKFNSDNNRLPDFHHQNTQIQKTNTNPKQTFQTNYAGGGRETSAQRYNESPNRQIQQEPVPEQSQPIDNNQYSSRSHTKQQPISQERNRNFVSQLNSEQRNRNEKQQRQQESISNTQGLEYVVQTFRQGSRYQGYKLNDLRHGEGKFFYQDGGMYDGQWKMNRMDGYGALYYQSGKLAYEGMWVNDQFQGKGKLYNETPYKLQGFFDYTNFDEIQDFWEYYEGDFCQDFKKGIGKLVLANNQYFQGTFNNDMVEGPGTFYRRNGQQINGIWRQNHLIEQS